MHNSTDNTVADSVERFKSDDKHAYDAEGRREGRVRTISRDMAEQMEEVGVEPMKVRHR